MFSIDAKNEIFVFTEFPHKFFYFTVIR